MPVCAQAHERYYHTHTWCLGTLVQDGLTHMRGVTWRAVPAKFKTDV